MKWCPLGSVSEMHLILPALVFPDPCAKTITFEHGGFVVCLKALCSQYIERQHP